MKSTRRWQQLLLNSLAIILGNALYSLAVALFLEPAGLITGGATGIALAFGRLTGLSVSGFLFLFNMSMLVWGWAVLGKKFALNTLASSVLSPAFLALFERLLDDRVLTEDIFLCTIFSGLGIGVALGMVIRAGASTGGMDIPPLVLQKWFRWPVSVTMMLFDIAILLVQAAFSQPEQVLYGIVLVITHTIVMDKMLMLVSGLDPEKPDVATLESMISMGTDALKRDPFSPKILNLMSFAYGGLGDEVREKAYSNRMNGVIRTILASGDGFTQKTPRHVLMFDHALDVLAAEGLSYGKARIVSRTVEFVPLTVPYVVEGKKRKGFYFDFGRVYWNKPEVYTYKRDRTWQFNNLKPRTYK